MVILVNPKVKRSLNYLLSFALAAFFLYIAFRGSDINAIIDSIEGAKWGWLLLFIPIALLSHIVRAWRWMYFLEPVKKDIRWRNLFYAVMIGYFFNSILPRFGEVARPYAMKKLEDIPLSTAVGSVIVERFLDLLFLVMLFALSLVFFRNEISEAFPTMESWSIVISVASIGVLIFFGLMVFKTDETVVFVHKLNRFVPGKILMKVEELLRKVIDGFKVIHNREKYLIMFLLTLFMWFLYVLQFYVVFFAFDFVSNYGLNLLSALVVMVISSIGIIIPTPGGTGTFHFFCMASLSRLFHIPEGQALGYATSVHAVGYIFLLVVGALSLMLANINIAEAGTVEVEPGE